MKYLFNETIDGKASWGRLFQSKEAFSPLAEHIFSLHNLPFKPLQNLSPGTNAVFRSGGYAIKIFAPAESGFSTGEDAETEIFAASRAASLGVPVPRPAASGYIKDRYRFPYMITDYIEGEEFSKKAPSMNAAEKRRFGRLLREAVDIIDTPCEPFNNIDIAAGGDDTGVWNKFPDSFLREREKHLSAGDFGPPVFVHGDLCGDNILIGEDGGFYFNIIDFADACLAPAIYEHALVAAELFRFDPDFIRGYFGDLNGENLVGLCLDGLLLHRYGGGVIAANVCEPREAVSVGILKEKIAEAINKKVPYGKRRGV